MWQKCIRDIAENTFLKDHRQFSKNQCPLNGKISKTLQFTKSNQNRQNHNQRVDAISTAKYVKCTWN